MNKDFCNRAIIGWLLISAFSSASVQQTNDYLEMSLEELSNVEVSLATKKEESIFTVPSAAYVLTSEDIRRSGATTVMEAMRLVPGLNVAQLNAHTWAISSRGFNQQYANKLQVMIDNRSVYTPLYGGVFWDMQSLMIEDVERIEVIRGPGGALWGANAVNGIINIVTKKASDTQNGLMSATAGSNRGIGSLRYGGKLGSQTFYRAWSQYYTMDDSYRADDHKSVDGWNATSGGFRIDSMLSKADTLMLQGSAFENDAGNQETIYLPTVPFYTSTVVNDKNILRGFNFLSRWTRQIDTDSDITLQAYFDRNERHTRSYDYVASTLDFDFQHHLVMNDSHELTWGAGFRTIRDDIDGTLVFDMNPDKRTMNLYSVFIQDKITLKPEQLYLTLGSKFEHNSYTHFEYQPSAKLLWTPDSRQTVWAGVSRAVHVPTRYDRDSTTLIAVMGPTQMKVLGSDDVESEQLLAYEIGYRSRQSETLFWDVSLFLNDYDKLRTTERKTTPGLTALEFDNKMRGQVYGGELAATWQARKDWTIKSGYSLLFMDLTPYDSSNYTGDADIETRSPQNQFFVHSMMNLDKNLELDLMPRYTDSLLGAGADSIFDLDVRLSWHITPNAELSIVGQNLLNNHHAEYASDAAALNTETSRACWLKLVYRF
jgi:iron complex outermembrane receptor protein